MSGSSPRSSIKPLFDLDTDIDRFRFGLLPPREEDNDNPMPWNKAAYGSLVNFPGSAKDVAIETGEGLKEMLLHPIRTAAALKDLAVGTAQLPIPGEQGKEDIPRELARMLGEQYGSEEAFKQTMHDNPAQIFLHLL